MWVDVWGERQREKEGTEGWSHRATETMFHIESQESFNQRVEMQYLSYWQKSHHIKISDSGQILNLSKNKINKINLQLSVHCKHFNICQTMSPPFATNHLLKV